MQRPWSDWRQPQFILPIRFPGRCFHCCLCLLSLIYLSCRPDGLLPFQNIYLNATFSTQTNDFSNENSALPAILKTYCENINLCPFVLCSRYLGSSQYYTVHLVRMSYVSCFLHYVQTSEILWLLSNIEFIKSICLPILTLFREGSKERVWWPLPPHPHRQGPTPAAILKLTTFGKLSLCSLCWY